MAGLGRILCRGDDGVFLTTTEAGNTSNNGDIPFTVVSPSNTSRIAYETTPLNDITEDSYILIDGTAGNVNEVRKTMSATVTKGAWQMVFRLRTLPSAIVVAGSMRQNAAGNIEARVTAGNAGALNANGTTFDTAATAFNTTDLYCWDMYIETGASTTTGKAKHRIRKINSDGSFTVVHNGTLFTDKNTGVTGTNNFDSWRWGKITGTPAMGINLLEVAWHDNSTDYCADPLTGICGTDQTQEPWSIGELEAVGYGDWSQISGTSITLLGTGKHRTYEVPASLVSSSATMGYGGDVAVNTFLPATDATKIGGVIVPVRLRTGLSIATYGE